MREKSSNLYDGGRGGLHGGNTSKFKISEARRLRRKRAGEG